MLALLRPRGPSSPQIKMGVGTEKPEHLLSLSSGEGEDKREDSGNPA